MCYRSEGPCPAALNAFSVKYIERTKYPRRKEIEKLAPLEPIYLPAFAKADA